MAEIRRGGFHRVVLLTVVLLLMVTIPTEADPEDEDCAECHGLFRRFEIVPQGPSEVPVGDIFNVSLTILNHDNRGIHYEIRGIEAEINVSGNGIVVLAPDEQANRTHENIPRAGSGTISWSLAAEGIGRVEVRFEMVGTAHFEHDSDNPDDATYRLETSIGFEVKEFSVSLTEYSIKAYADEYRSVDVAITAKENITNVSFLPTGGVSGIVNVTSDEADWADGFLSVPSGGVRTFSVVVSLGAEGTGTVQVSWDDAEGIRRHLNMTVTVITAPVMGEDDVDFLRLAGRISGIAEIPLAAAVIILGGFPRQFKPGMKKLGKRRISLHCNISYAMLAIAIFHLAVLLAGPFANVLFSNGIIMGFLALAFLIGLAVNGAAMKFMIKRLGRKYWHRIHVIMSIGFIVSMSMHAYRIGTEFAFLR